MTMDERFEQIGVPTSAELPDDLRSLVERELEAGRCLCITKVREGDVVRAEWCFLRDRRKDQRIEIIPDPTKPPPYDPEDL